MGERGPVPNRSDQRRRRNKPVVPVVKAPGAVVVPVPDPDLEWHPVALRLWESLVASGQSAWYEPSDWAAAYVLCESMSRELHPQPVVSKDGVVQWVKMPPKPASLTAWKAHMTALMVSEGDRRRASVELERVEPDSGEVGDVARIDDIRARLRGAG